MWSARGLEVVSVVGFGEFAHAGYGYRDGR
jgi:hypothetical protein